MKITEEKLENAIVELLGEQSYPHVLGASLVREPQDVLITLIAEDGISSLHTMIQGLFDF